MATRRSGFTLLELLLVMTIIGILAATVTLAVSDTGQRQRLQSEAERVALAIELARTEALTRNEIWGLSVAPTTYAFQVYDLNAGAWREVEEQPFQRRTAEDGVVFRAQTNFARLAQAGNRVDEESTLAERLLQGNSDDDPPPTIAIFPGGEVTPFQLVVSSGDLTRMVRSFRRHRTHPGSSGRFVGCPIGPRQRPQSALKPCVVPAGDLRYSN